MSGTTLYGYTLAGHEYSVTVPRMYTGDSEPTVIIAISAHGGGTPGESYRDNGWDYAVYSDGTEIIAGGDLRSNGTPGTHAGMARVLCSFLAADAETLRCAGPGGTSEGPACEYSADVQAFLISEGERLGMFAVEV